MGERVGKGGDFLSVFTDDADRPVVDEELGTVVWPNGADLDPDALYNQSSRDSA